MLRKLTKLTLAAAAAACLGLTGCSTVEDALDGNQPDRDEAGQITESAQIDAVAIRVGDCFNFADLSGEFSEAPAIPCTEPHDSETILAFDAELDAYDSAAIEEQAEARCAEALTDYVGPNAESYDPPLYGAYLTPTSSGWPQGDHEILCMAVAETSTLTGSVKGVAP
jgi:hypothetical protein